MDTLAAKLEISWKAVGQNGIATLTAKMRGMVVAIEKVDLTKPKTREAFRESLCNEFPALDPGWVDAELLKIAAALLSAKAVDPTPVPLADGKEVDISRIVRPERFITAAVSGLTVPIATDFDGKIIALWKTYMQWANGRRECCSVQNAIEVHDGTQIFVHPQPSLPTVNMPCGWTAHARDAWLKGSTNPEPVELFKRICDRIDHYVALSTRGATATLALWIMLTYLYPAWDAVPYLYVGGPAGSGKTRLFHVLAKLVFRPLFSSSITAAALFRTLHNQGGTLLFDEAERLKGNAPEVAELLSMLLAGYKRGGQATRLEPVGDTFKMVTFDVYGPKALACIAGLPGPLLSRCITVMMFRTPPQSPMPRRRIDSDPAWGSLRDDLHALTLSEGPLWIEYVNCSSVCPEWSGRDYELWQPLLALAAYLEDHGNNGLLRLVQEHAQRTITEYADNQVPDADETLLRALTEKIVAGQAPSPGALLAIAKQRDVETFMRWSPRGIAARLERYNLHTNKTGGNKVYGRVTTADLCRIQSNYGIDLGLAPHEPVVAHLPHVPQVPA